MRKNKINVAIKNAISTDDTMEIYFLDLLYDHIAYDWYTGSEWCSNMVNDVVQQVRYEKPSKIKLIIESEGGDAKIGIALYNFFKFYNARIEVEILGMCGSIASVLAQAASKGKFKIPRNGWMVIHQAWGSATGEADDLRNAADVIDMYTTQIVDIYVQNNRVGMTHQSIADLIAGGDYWMDGTLAVEMGFADETYNNDAIVQVAARIQTLDERYVRIPETLKAAAALTATKTAENGGRVPGAATVPVIVNEVPTEEENEAQGNIANTVKNKVVKSFKELAAACIGGIKNKVIKKDADNLSGAIADEIGGPLTEMVETMHTEIMNELGDRDTRLETAIMNAVEGKYGKIITDLQAANASLLEENATLTREAAENTGKETPAGGASISNAIEDAADWSKSATVYKSGSPVQA